MIAASVKSRAIYKYKAVGDTSFLCTPGRVRISPPGALYALYATAQKKAPAAGMAIAAGAGAELILPTSNRVVSVFETRSGYSEYSGGDPCYHLALSG